MRVFNEQTNSSFLRREIYRRRLIIKYGLAGGTAVAVNLAALYFFTEVFGVWYVASAAVAFLFSLLTGFLLQKFWTFRDRDLSRLKKQMAIYAAVGLVNLILDPVLLYLLVEAFALWYILAQILVLGGLAIESYLLNRFITFRKDRSYEGFDVKH